MELSIQRSGCIRKYWEIRETIIRQKRRLSRKEQNSNNSKETLEKIQKIENKLDNVYNDYMNKCISVVIKSNPTCVVIVENNQKFLQKYFIFLFLLLFSAVAGGSFAHDAVRPLLQALVFFFGEPHERAVLRMFHALHGDGGVEVGEFLVGLTDAVSFGFWRSIRCRPRAR